MYLQNEDKREDILLPQSLYMYCMSSLYFEIKGSVVLFGLCPTWLWDLLAFALCSPSSQSKAINAGCNGAGVCLRVCELFFQLACCKAWHWFGLRGHDWPEVTQMVSVPRGELELGLPAPSPKPQMSNGLSAQGHRIYYIIFFCMLSLHSFHSKIYLLRCILIFNLRVSESVNRIIWDYFWGHSITLSIRSCSPWSFEAGTWSWEIPWSARSSTEQLEEKWVFRTWKSIFWFSSTVCFKHNGKKKSWPVWGLYSTNNEAK